MPNIQRILCAIDFSEGSREALRHAASLGAAHGARVTALHVLQIATPVTTAYPIGYPASVWTPEDLGRLEDDVKRFVDMPGLQAPVEAQVAMGHVAGTIVQWASELPADLVVVGTHGRSGFERLVLGSVAERVVRHASCPVLTIPPRVADAASEATGRYRRILCAVDFSRDSLRGLEYASQLARSSEGSLTVIHVVEPLPAYVPAVPGAPLQEYDETVPEQATRRLHEVVGQVAGPLPVREVVVSGRAHEEILETARREGSDLIVAGIAGRGAVDVAFFGSTANHLLRRAACPVLTVKPGTP